MSDRDERGTSSRDGAASSLRIAAVTMTRDEGEMLRLWVAHHGRQFGHENLLVLDDGSTDGSTEDLGCTVHRIPGLPGGGSFEASRMRLVSGIGAGLLAAYDYVVFTDVDEFLVVDPRFGSLAELLEARGRPEVVGSTAMDLVQLPGEPPIDLGRPLLQQRAFAKFSPVMCKPAVKRVPAKWAVGSHGVAAPYAVDPDLYMFHLKFVDRDRLIAVADKRYAAFLEDGRAELSGWSKDAQELVARYDAAIAAWDPATAPEFDPHAEDLAGITADRGDGVWRTRRVGLWVQPLVRVPAQLAASF